MNNHFVRLFNVLCSHYVRSFVLGVNIVYFVLLFYTEWLLLMFRVSTFRDLALLNNLKTIFLNDCLYTIQVRKIDNHSRREQNLVHTTKKNFKRYRGLNQFGFLSWYLYYIVRRTDMGVCLINGVYSLSENNKNVRLVELIWCKIDSQGIGYFSHIQTNHNTVYLALFIKNEYYHFSTL